MEQRIVKGIWFPIEIWENKELSWNEKILLMEIDSFTNNDKDFFMSDERIAEFLSVHQKSANRILSGLIQKGYVVKVGFDGRKRNIRSTLRYVTPEVTPTLPQTQQECYHTNNSLLNSIDKSIPTNNKKVSKKFVKPTLDEVREYCRERGNAVSADRFWNYYESKGWVVGKSPMKDWKAAVRTWERSEQTEAKPQRSYRKKDSFREQVETAEKMFGSDYARAMYGVSFLDQNVQPDEQ